MPNVLRLLEMLAWIDLQEGNAESACQRVKQILRADSGNISAHCIRLYLAEGAGLADEKTEQSILILKECKPQNDNDAYQAALALAMMGYYIEAERLFKSALAEDPYNIFYLQGVAANAYHMDKLEKAKYYWGRLAMMMPDDPIANYYDELIKSKVNTYADVPHRFDLPANEQMRALRMIRMANSNLTIRTEEQSSELYRALLWGLYYGEDAFKPLCMALLTQYFVFDAPDIFRNFLMLPDKLDEHKHEAVKYLSQIGVKQPYYALMESGLAQIWNDAQPDDAQNENKS